MSSQVKIDGILYELDSFQKTACVLNSEYSGIVNIPNSVVYNNKTYQVTSIGVSAFYGCKGLISVTIGNNVRSIEECAFVGCENLASLTIGNSVKTIGPCAFSDCRSLTSVTLPNSVTKLN